MIDIKLKSLLFLLIVSVSRIAGAVEPAFPIQADDAKALLHQIFLPLQYKLSSLYYHSHREMKDRELILNIDEYSACKNGEYRILLRNYRIPDGWSQQVNFYPCNKDPGQIRIDRTGPNTKPISIEDLLLVNIPAPETNQSLKIKVSWLPNFLIEIENRNDRVLGVFAVPTNGESILIMKTNQFFHKDTVQSTEKEFRIYDFYYSQFGQILSTGTLKVEKTTVAGRELDTFEYFGNGNKMNPKDFSKSYQEGAVNGIGFLMGIMLTQLPGPPPISPN